jgi:hypothetical protein
MQYHKYSLTEIENMMPWERDIYVAYYNSILKKKKLPLMQQKQLLGGAKQTEDDARILT